MKAKDQDKEPKEKKTVGYFFDEENGSVEVTADNFSYLLEEGGNSSLIKRASTLNISDTQVYEKFKELFNEAYGIKGG